MGTKRLESIEDCLRHGVRIRIRCEQCRRERLILNGMNDLLREKGIRGNMPVRALRHRLKCGNCGAKLPIVDMLGPASALP